MKENYEKRSQTSLLRRIPVIIRSDGKNFHKFCKRFKKPYDNFLNNSLNEVMLFLCENIQGCKFAQRHSDEISLLVTDFDTLQTDAFFDYEVQKICSVVASMATAEFCRTLAIYPYESEIGEARKVIIKPNESWPNFDTRCFNIPENEIANYFWWRMLDSKRNSISMTAQANFSHKELQGKSSSEMQEMLWQEKGINWANLPQGQKIGFVCFKRQVEKEIPAGPQKGEKILRNIWSAEESPSSKSDLDKLFENVSLCKEE
jgi:tRNA(His) 5'-end guanylyltransferase